MFEQPLSINYIKIVYLTLEKLYIRKKKLHVGKCIYTFLIKEILSMQTGKTILIFKRRKFFYSSLHGNIPFYSRGGKRVAKISVMDKLFLFLHCNRPTSGGVVLHSKLVDGRCQVQSPVALFDLVILEFSVIFSETRVNTGYDSLERSPRRASQSPTRQVRQADNWP